MDNEFPKVQGVYYTKKDKRWIANLQINRCKVFSQRFKTYDEAVSARKEAEKRYPNYRRFSTTEEERNRIKREGELKRHARNPQQRLLYLAKHRAKRTGLDFNLDESDIIVPEYCPITRLPLIFGQNGIGCWFNHSASLDRIDPSKGYVKGNVAVISMWANRLKCDCTDPDIFRAIADYLEKHNNIKKPIH